MSEKGHEPYPDKIAVIDGLATPTNAREIAKLLGHVGWYRELIINYSKIVVPITQLLRNDCKFEWTEVCQRAFEELKDKLSIYPMLRPPD